MRSTIAVFAIVFSLGSASGAMSATSPIVKIKDDAFVPTTVTVSPGTTVNFANVDGEAHTVTADDGSFDSKPMTATWEHTFMKPGRYAYHCTIHADMHGTIVVTQAPA